MSETRPEFCASLGLVTHVTGINENVTKPKVKPDGTAHTNVYMENRKGETIVKTGALGDCFAHREGASAFPAPPTSCAT